MTGFSTIVSLTLATTCVAQDSHEHGHQHADGTMHYGDHGNGHEDHEENHGHMHANGEMHYGDHGEGHMENMDDEGFQNPHYDPDFVLTNEDFLKLDAETFWNEVLPKLDHNKLDEIIAEFDKDHLQKMLSGMPQMDFDDEDHMMHGDEADFLEEEEGHFDEDDEDDDGDVDLSDIELEPNKGEL